MTCWLGPPADLRHSLTGIHGRAVMVPEVGTDMVQLVGTIRKEVLAVAVSASEARSRLFPLIQQVNDDHTPVRINSRGGDAVLMSAEDFDSWQETIYLLRSPANARRLMEAVARDKSGQVTVVKTMEELRALAGE